MINLKGIKRFIIFNFFDFFFVFGLIFVNLLYSALSGESDWPGSIAAVSGVICVVLVAKGNILNYIFGVINVSLYAWIAFKAQLYGDALLNGLYYLPMQFVGWFLWSKRRESDSSVVVETKVLDSRGRVALFVVSLTLTCIVGYFLDIFGDPQPYKDSATTVLSVIAMFLMVKAYSEQWILWAVVNLISIIIWSISWVKGIDHSPLMVLMWSAYFINSVNGWFFWSRRALDKE